MKTGKLGLFILVLLIAGVAGGQTSMSNFTGPAAPSRPARSFASSSPAARRPFIFQFPAISLRRTGMGSISFVNCGIGDDVCLASGGGYFHTVDASRVW